MLMQPNFFTRTFTVIQTMYANYKIRREKRRNFNNQIIKHNLNMCQFFNIKRLMTNDGEEEDDDESTFRKLDYVAELGLTPSNENLWPTITKVAKSRNKRKVIPLNVPDGS